jgi:hypothetical protein
LFPDKFPFSASLKPNKPANIMSFIGFNGAAAVVVAQVCETKTVLFIVLVFVDVAGADITGVVQTVVVGEVAILVAAEALFFGFPRSF